VDNSGGTLVVKLTDFDLSRDAETTHTRGFSGTLAYMAPEQLKKHGTVGPAVDIFAFGVMAYNLVTGRMPFQGTTKKESLRLQATGSSAAVSPRRLNPGLGPRLDELIMQCLERDPAKRFPSMSYLCQELGGV
jgi:serine/threonine-protein kinase